MLHNIEVDGNNCMIIKYEIIDNVIVMISVFMYRDKVARASDLYIL